MKDNSYLIEVDGVEYMLEVIGDEVVVREFTQDWKNLMGAVLGKEDSLRDLIRPPKPMFSFKATPRLKTLIFEANDFYDAHNETADPDMDEEITDIAEPVILSWLHQREVERLKSKGIARPDHWVNVIHGIERYRDVHRLTPYLLVGSFWRGCKAYYGGTWRALWRLGIEDLRSWWSMEVEVRFLIWISDTVGWTKLYRYPETDETIAHLQRHGWKCSGSPNCDDPDCISRSLPPWFKKLTGWHED